MSFKFKHFCTFALLSLLLSSAAFCFDGDGFQGYGGEDDAGCGLRGRIEQRMQERQQGQSNMNLQGSGAGEWESDEDPS